MTAFSFSLPTQVFFGAGSRHKLLEVATDQRWRRLGFVVDSNLREQPAVSALLDQTRAGCERVVIGWMDGGEPTYDGLEALRGQFADGALDAVVGIGGGSALDTAKGMAALVHNRRPAVEYRGFGRLTAPVLPIVAVPTTAGTGSEVTPNASFVDTAEQRKMGINGEAVRPRFALLDPELTVTCPPGPTLSAAIDSLVHATEAFVAKKTNAMARLMACAGFGRVFNHLPRVVADPVDLASRTEVMYGAFLSGLALMHSGTGPAAAMSYPLGVHHAVPHGIAGGIFLPRVAALNVDRGVVDYAELYDSMHGARCAESQAWRACAFVDQLQLLWQRVGMPTTLTSLGVTPAASDRLVTGTLALEAALAQNPVPFGEPEIRQVVRDLSELPT